MIIRRGMGAASGLEDRERLIRSLEGVSLPSSVVLTTCDRVEIYEGEGEPEPQVVRHLFRVVAGLESPLLGEHQIQGQVKRAYQEATSARPLGPGMHRLFQQALRVGKRIRSETALGRGAHGHAHVVVDVLRRLPIPLTELKILVIGVNHLNRGILRFLMGRGHRTFLLGNRSLEKARALVAELGSGEALSLESLQAVLSVVDVVISATSAPHLIVKAEHLPETGGPRWFFDLAVPRDLDPRIAERPGVSLYNVADLERLAQQTLERRSQEVLKAEAILESEVERYFQ